LKAPHRSRARSVGRAVALCIAAGAVSAAVGQHPRPAFAAEVRTGAVSSIPAAPDSTLRELRTRSERIPDRLRPEDDSLKGRSGKLRALLVPRSGRRVGVLQRLFGDSLLQTPGVHDLRDSSGTAQFALITMRDFTEKLGGRIGEYNIGFWPAERGRTLAEMYDNPEGFIEVTPENADTRVSEHFRLRDFLTHDQQAVWPKYLVLRAPLVDKLELVIADLEAHGTRVRRMRVMSGFRTPQYNKGGGNTGGRAGLSRHMYGDAADIFIDSNGDGVMDDLNHNGRHDIGDARVVSEAVDRVEAAHPELIGGAGVYPAASGHGPFIHIDTRGYRARWIGSGGGS